MLQTLQQEVMLQDSFDIIDIALKIIKLNCFELDYIRVNQIE